MAKKDILEYFMDIPKIIKRNMFYHGVKFNHGRRTIAKLTRGYYCRLVPIRLRPSSQMRVAHIACGLCPSAFPISSGAYTAATLWIYA